jgi:hypothetical protein
MGDIDQSSVACQEEAKLSEDISGDKGQGLGEKGLQYSRQSDCSTDAPTPSSLTVWGNNLRFQPDLGTDLSERRIITDTTCSNK